MKQRHHNHGLRKVCDCPRRAWAKCAHPWHVNYKVRGGPSYRFSLDAELGRHIQGKTEAANEAEKIRTAIREGTFRRRAEVSSTPSTAPLETTTFRKLGEIWLGRRGKARTESDTGYLNRLAAFVPPGQTALGDQPVTAVTADVFELFFDELRRQGRANGTRNKYRGFLMAMLRWGVKKGYLTHNHLADSDTIKRVSEKGARRSRRLAPDVFDAKGKLVEQGEEMRLLQAATPALQRLIIGALETGMRLGELRDLRWHDVSLPRRELRVRAETSKTETSRDVVMSDRLAGALEMARTGPDGKEFGPFDFVFGDVGQKFGSIKKAWATTVLKAHGYTPKWIEHGKLSPECRAALRNINLRFHDLRHEAGSRLIESGMPAHEVQAQLGHADLSQTTTYLNTTLERRKASMRRADEARARCKPVANEALMEHRPVCNDDKRENVKPLVN
jgi:integrase